MLLFKSIFLEFLLNILVGTERMRCCMILPTESTIISQINNNREDINDYLRQLCWSNLENSSRGRREEMLLLIPTKIQLIIRLTSWDREEWRLCEYSDTKYNYI